MFKSLQAMRALAALLVVLFHSGAVMALPKYFGIEGFAIPFSFGHAGVEFFFVLSGFIIIYVHYPDFGDPSRLKLYCAKRFIRVYPSYWIVFLAVYFVAIAIPATRNTVPSLFSEILWSLLLLPQSGADDGGIGTGSPVLIVAWTLQYEMAFYIFVAVTIISRLVAALLATTLSILLIFGDVTVFPLSFIGCDWVLLFGVGAGVALLARRGLRVESPRIFATFGGVAFLGIGMFEVFGYLNILCGAERLLYGAASALIIIGLIGMESGGSTFGHGRIFHALGDSSYALYLVHFPIVSVVCKVFKSLNILTLPFSFLAFFLMFFL